MKNIVGMVCLISVVLIMSMGCIESFFVNAPSEKVITESTELDKLMQFLEADNTNEITYYADPHRGTSFFVCSGYSRALSENATKYNITMGAISLRDTPGVGKVTKYYHAMNYVIVDDRFVIIEPQSDEIFYLDTIQRHNGAYRYISIYRNAQMMSNFGKGRKTIDIDLCDYNESEIVERWK